MHENLLTAQEASDFLGISASTVTRLAKTEKLGHVNVGSRKAFRHEDLAFYLEKENLTPAPVDSLRTSEKLPELVGLSFFSGAGGLDIGLERAGIPSLLYAENNVECRMTLRHNRPDAALVGDVSSLNGKLVRQLARVPDNREIDVMFGGPPCQAFSTAGARRAFDDERGNIFLKFIGLARELQPRYLIIENVRGLLSTPFPLEPDGDKVRGGALQKILTDLEDMGYGVSFNLYNSANFGAPQSRERVILIAKRDGTKMSYLTPTHSDDPQWGLKPWVSFNQATQRLNGIKHNHSQFPERRLRYFAQLTEGQNWRNLPENEQPEAMGKAYALGGGKTGFYRRLHGNKPSPTIVTSPTMPATDLCHPRELRPLSVEEYKVIQGFPDEWWIAGSITEQYRQLGNAVPVQLGEAIGRAVVADMNSNNEQSSNWIGFKYSRYKRTSNLTWSVDVAK